MKKRIALLIVVLILCAGYVRATIALSDKVITGGTIFNPVKTTYSTATGIDTAGGIVFTAQELTINSWVLLVTNSGDNALTDLKIKLLPSKGSAIYIDVVAIASSITSLDNTCTTTLATPETCIASSPGGLPYGYIEITAAAADANKATLEFTLLEVP